jgi:hypothetical protein
MGEREIVGAANSPKMCGMQVANKVQSVVQVFLTVLYVLYVDSNEPTRALER